MDSCEVFSFLTLSLNFGHKFRSGTKMVELKVGGAQTTLKNWH